MEIGINCVTADKVMRCKKDTPEVLQHIKLVNPQVYENEILFDVIITLPDNFTVTSRYDMGNEYLVITLSNLGSIELNTKDFRDVMIY